MALSSSNVGVAVSGEIYYGPTSAAVPTTTTSATTGYVGLGYVGEDGLVETPEVSRESLRAWQNGATVRESVTEAKLSYEFTLIETTVDSVELYRGTTVTQAAAHGTYTYVVGATKGRKSWIIDVIDTATGDIQRTYVGEGELFAAEGVTYANGEAIAYPCSLVCYTAPQVWDTRLKTPA